MPFRYDGELAYDKNDKITLRQKTDFIKKDQQEIAKIFGIIKEKDSLKTEVNKIENNSQNKENKIEIKENMEKENINIKKAYLSVYANWVDLFVAILGFIDLIYSNDLIAASSFKVLRLFRSLRQWPWIAPQN